MNEILDTLIVVFSIFGFGAYITPIIIKKTSENSKTTWLIWACLDTVALIGMHQKEAINKQIISSVIGAWFVALLLLWYGRPGWSKTDQFCLAGALGGIIALARSSPMLGIFINLGTILLGSIPLFLDAWKNPAHESKIAWTAFLFAAIFAVLAIPAYTWEDAL